MKLFAELKRRNVIRVALFYTVAAWLLVQVAETLLPLFDVPDGVLRGLVILLALGFMPAMVSAWVYELTPEGLKRESDPALSDGMREQGARRLNIAVIALLLLAIGLFGYERLRGVPGPPARVAEVSDAPAPMAQTGEPAAPGRTEAAQSIAVLAFADLSPGRDQEYFADGIAEEILNTLARVPGLRVAGRTSAFHFKGRNEDLRSIGATLGVAHVLEGSVRKQGERLRITAQLIRSEDGLHLWSETYNGTDADVFALQERIARSIVDELQLVLDAGQKARLVDAGTSDPHAYALFLHARGVFNRRDSAEFPNAIRLLEEAVGLDPNFAPAWSKLGALHVLSPEYLGADLGESNDAAESYARRALALRPRFAEPLAIIAYASMQREHRYVEARAALEQALAIEPDDPTSNLWHAVHLSVTGYQRARIERLEHLLAIDPLLPNALNHYGAALEWAGDLDRARQTLERARELGAANTDHFLAFVSLRQGRMAEARIELERSVDFFGAFLPAGTNGIIAHGILGDGDARARALEHVRTLVAAPATADAGILAWALILLGDHDAALAMVAERPMNSTAWHAALWSPRGQAARTSPAFPEFARRVGFAELWDKHGPPDLCRKDANGDYRCE
jgi:TolB-like protein/Tfp pilus assembly protein PilF